MGAPRGAFRHALAKLYDWLDDLAVTAVQPGPTGPQGPQGLASAGTSVWEYKAKANMIDGNPGDNFLRWDHATQISSTHLAISHDTNNNEDIDIFLAMIAASTKIIVQDQNVSENYQVWEVTAPPTNVNPASATSYWDIPVTLVSSLGTGTTNFANNHILLVAIFTAASRNVFTVATLPNGVVGDFAFASDLRVFDGAGTLEGPGVGSGGHVSHNGTDWRVAGTNVTASA